MSFLRRVRHKLALEGETKRHGFFMLAEMVLIMVGITAALQFDTWKQDIKERKTEVVLLTQLNNEFLQIKQDIYTAYKDLDARHILLLDLYLRCGNNSEHLTDDEISEIFGNTMQKNLFLLQHGVLDEALNTGRISIVQNSELRVLLYSWKHSDNKVNSHLKRFNYLVDRSEEIWFEKIPTRNIDIEGFPSLGITRSELATDPNSIFQDLHFENIMGYLHGVNEGLYEQYADEYLVPANRIIELIEIELEKSKTK